MCVSVEKVPPVMGFEDCQYFQNASTPGPSGDVALEERSEIVSSWWEFLSSVADPREGGELRKWTRPYFVFEYRPYANS
jgi:hypothetical protein